MPSMCQDHASDFHMSSHLSLLIICEINIVIPKFPLSKLRLREIKLPGQHHEVCQ